MQPIEAISQIQSQTPATTTTSTQTPIPADKYQWLEDVYGEKPMAWVKAENERSAKILEADPRFAPLAADALKVLESPDRLAIPQLSPGYIYNTWQDAQHVRGILRRTSLADYLKPNPDWHTVIDYDALAKADKQSWVQHGLNCLFPGDKLCLVALSAGGEDADTQREFDLQTGTFVANGFNLPKSKQDVTWLDKDTLLIGRDWGPGTMTKSGYPFVIKSFKRGQTLQSAKEIYRGTETDVQVGAFALHDAQGHSAILIRRGIDFFHSEIYLLTANGTARLALPGKADINGLLHGQIIITLNESWKPEGHSETFVQGTVVSLSLEAVQKDPAHLKPTIIFTPTTTEFAQEVGVTRNHLIVTTLDTVQGRASTYARAANGTWQRHKLTVPDNQTIEIASTDPSTDQFFLSVTSFLTPSSLLLGDAATESLKEAKATPPQFDASRDLVEQLFATSKDGTKVPYFVVRRKDLKYDGSNPTLISAYGGFQVSRTPAYSGTVGKLWLERGGVYVLANIRGGGEFGPAWHEAGLKTNRQRIYDDFTAVSEDLITRKITSPRRLGIVGGSNGGLLMGVQMTQHPELYNAIVIQVPLLDMLGFEHIAAGASWVGEYGSIANPDERKFLASISPYNNLHADTNYPEPLIFTTTKDDRVGPVHARKFAALLKELNKPYYYQEITEGGHGSGADLKQSANTFATQYTYLTRKLMD
ncbi:MAG: Prolyl oligopeptidase [Acidobacteriaceae bacterium]|nr:Prolyl oligopeptidase [Acidobacteriaceae bacterium]